MQIITGFYDDILDDCAQRDDTPAIKVYFHHDGRSYPDSAWFDNGTILLAWWTTDYTDLVQGAKSASFNFMEGPFCLRVTRYNDELTFYTEQQSVFGACSLSELRQTLDEMGKAMTLNFKRLGLWADYTPPTLL